MKDFIGNELNISDFVVYVNHSGNFLKSGVVIKILKTKIKIRPTNFQKSVDTAFPEHICKIN
jgi:hypothetical protein